MGTAQCQLSSCCGANNTPTDIQNDINTEARQKNKSYPNKNNKSQKRQKYKAAKQLKSENNIQYHVSMNLPNTENQKQNDAIDTLSSPKVDIYSKQYVPIPLMEYINKKCCKIIPMDKSKYGYWRNYHAEYIEIVESSTNHFCISFWSVLNKHTDTISTEPIKQIINVSLEDKAFEIHNRIEIDPKLRYIAVFNKTRNKFKIISTKLLKEKFVENNDQFTYIVPIKHPTHNISNISQQQRKLFGNAGNYFVVLNYLNNSLDFNIYSYRNNSLYLKIKADVVMNNRYFKNDVVRNNNLNICTDKSVELFYGQRTSKGINYYKHYFDANNNYKSVTIDFSSPMQYQRNIVSLSNEYLFRYNYDTQCCLIANVEGDTLHILNKWKLNVLTIKGSRGPWPIETSWYNDDIVIFYFSGFLFVFMSATNNTIYYKMYKKILMQWYSNLNDNLIDIILKNIGFECYGSWLVNSKPLYFDHHNPKEGPFIPRLTRINAYFGNKKNYVVITRNIMGEWLEITVDLDMKYAMSPHQQQIKAIFAHE